MKRQPTISRDDKSTLMPKLRFPEFHDDPQWRAEKLGALIETVSPPSKLQSSSYLKHGKYPIIDQSQDFICGWTDDEAAVITGPLPLIVFGDHTCILKFVDRPFVQGADGIKIIKAKASIVIEFLFQSLNHHPLLMEDYKRHFSTLKERVVVLPDVTSGEQQKIAECLASLDALIGFEKERLEALKAFKKGLMQQLFPREGERVPRLRFPEFRGSGEWEETTLGARAKVLKGKGVSKADIHQDGKLPCIRYGELYTKYSEIISDVESKTNVASEDLFLSVAGDVIIPSSGETKEDIATASCVLKTGIALGGDLNVLRSDLHGPFLSFYLNGTKKTAIAKVAQGDTVVHLYPNQLRALDIRVPDIDERKAIAKCLVGLSEQQTVSQKRVEVLILHKQGLMQKLFPSIDLPQ